MIANKEELFTCWYKALLSIMSSNFLTLKGIRLPYILYLTQLQLWCSVWSPGAYLKSLGFIWLRFTEPAQSPAVSVQTPDRRPPPAYSTHRLQLGKLNPAASPEPLLTVGGRSDGKCFWPPTGGWQATYLPSTILYVTDVMLLRCFVWFLRNN